MAWGRKFAAVSYTHLDVYKRQILHDVIAGAVGVKHVKHLDNAGMVELGPVSYTHLAPACGHEERLRRRQTGPDGFFPENGHAQALSLIHIWGSSI